MKNSIYRKVLIEKEITKNSIRVFIYNTDKVLVKIFKTKLFTLTNTNYLVANLGRYEIRYVFPVKYFGIMFANRWEDYMCLTVHNFDSFPNCYFTIA